VFGFINVYKPVGMTSHDVVSKLRRLLQFKHIGHGGTLDPFAEGVLPVFLGNASKLADYLSDGKEYIALLQFGAETDTYDCTGKITINYDNKVLIGDLEKVLKKFKGEIEQIPPMYSAIKLNGKKLYEYARKGQVVDIPKRKVVINEIELLKFDENKQTCKIRVSCSKGTYIRSLAKDIGNALGNGAYLLTLQRTVSGPFDIKNTISFNDIEFTTVNKHIINPIEVLTQYKHIVLSEKECKDIGFGRNIKRRVEDVVDGYVMLLKDDTLVSIGKVENDEIHPMKVLVND